MAQARRRSFRPSTAVLTIESIGGRGDGIARHDDHTVYVPFTAAGDRVRVRIEGRRGAALTAAAVEIVSPGPHRRAPPCRHFGVCGGCALQHLDAAAYGEWIGETVRKALAGQGLHAVAVAPPIATPPGGRRGEIGRAHV